MHKVSVVLVVAVFGATALIGALLNPMPPRIDFAEAQTIVQNVENFKDLSDRFASLAREKGGVYAYEVLLRAQLPPNTDVHLLGHTVGDELYKQKGVAGVSDCTQDFRNACSHTIVIGALNEFGEEALEMIRDACKKAPGGTGAYTMCFHGLGHGVFAYYGYEIPETVAFCMKTATEAYRDREYIECVGGMIMELTGGGGHDRERYLASREKYLTEDPLAPCSTSLIPDEVKGICYTYLSPHLFQRAGGNLAMPQKKDIKGAFEFCDRIPATEKQNRYSCFSGIGKELPVLAVARDTRAINTADENALGNMREMCSTAPHAESYAACTESIVDSLFWGGENNPDVSIRFCSMAEADERTACFSYLFGVAMNYVPTMQRSEFCALIPEAFSDTCKERLAL